MITLLRFFFFSFGSRLIGVRETFFFFCGRQKNFRIIIQHQGRKSVASHY